MHGPTRRAGAVAGMHDIKNAGWVAKRVMERTDHLLLVGEGATRFAVAQGFPKENLLTERSRKIWLLWKETMSNQDSWGPGLSDPNWKPPVEAPPQSHLEERKREIEEVAAQLGIEPAFRQHAVECVLFPPTGTIHVSAVNEKGEMSGATTTCGLSWKIPGRVGDSAIIGAGCWTDQDVGSAGATGRGEENIKIVGAHTIVENMRRGMEPKEAGLDALKRIVRNFNGDMTRLRFVDMVYYILRRDGAYAGVSLWSHGSTGRPRNFAVHDGQKRTEDCVALLQGSAISWPPITRLPKS
jgi:N4-(beta-N-acetylglucosaminyl)-L-asparaginase